MRLWVKENRIIRLCRPGNTEAFPAAIQSRDGVMNGYINGKGWLLVSRSGELSTELFGLPLNGTPPSWEFQWDHENMEIEICTGYKWVKVHDWNLIREALMYH